MSTQLNLGIAKLILSSWIVASLDRHETYLNFSTFQDEHVQYICGEKSTSQESFLTKPLGPWGIRDVKVIQHLVRIPVALALKANLVVLSPHDGGLCQVVSSTHIPRAIHVQLYMEVRPQWGSEIFLGVSLLRGTFRREDAGTWGSVVRKARYHLVDGELHTLVG